MAEGCRRIGSAVLHLAVRRSHSTRRCADRFARTSTGSDSCRTPPCEPALFAPSPRQCIWCQTDAALTRAPGCSSAKSFPFTSRHLSPSKAPGCPLRRAAPDLERYTLFSRHCRGHGGSQSRGKWPCASIVRACWGRCGATAAHVCVRVRTGRAAIASPMRVPDRQSGTACPTFQPVSLSSPFLSMT